MLTTKWPGYARNGTVLSRPHVFPFKPTMDHVVRNSGKLSF